MLAFDCESKALSNFKVKELQNDQVLDQNCCIKRSSNSADLLCQLVRGAQENDSKAIEELCNRYIPLIKKVAGNSYYRDHLGEDAVNIAWVIFLEFIKKYKGNDFVHLPGLLKIHLQYKLLRICKHQEVYKLEVPLIADDDSQEDIADPRNYIYDFEIRRLIWEIFRRLSQKQRIILIMVFLEGRSLKEVSKVLDIPYESVRSVYRKGLAKLRKLSE